MPVSWPAKKKAAHERGLEFLKSICESSQYMEMINLPNGLPKIRVKGTSRRWYSLVANPESTLIESEHGVLEKGVYWNFDVRAAPRKTDLLAMNKYSVRICIHPERRSRNMPIGDRLATLAMGLRDDRRTAVRIGLIAQFVIAPRDALIDVYKFTAEGVMYNEEIYSEHELLYDPITPAQMNTYLVQESDQISELFAYDEQAEANLHEHIKFQEWFDEKEEEIHINEASPWHHDENEIWKREEDFLRSLD